MKNVFIIIAGLIFLTISCKKENKPSHGDASSITMGDYTNMLVKQYDTMIVRDLFFKSFTIDLNDDHIDDIRLASFNLNGPMMGCYPDNGTSITCLNQNTSLASTLITDTVFFNFDTTYSSNGSTLIIFIGSRQSCFRIKPGDTIISVKDQNKIEPLHLNNKISRTDHFASDSITITHGSTGCMPFPVYQTPDTIIYYSTTDLNHCFTLPDENVFYIGIKCQEKLGWIKLLIFDEYKIMLLESAVQKGIE